MRPKLDTDNGAEWRTGLCCHVRTGTILLGVWHLVLYVLSLAVIAVVLVHPEMMNREAHDLARPVMWPYDVAHSGVIQIESERGHEYRTPFMRDCKWNNFDVNMGVVVILSTFMITVLMVYGAVKGNPRYLLPFFCLQVFDFCIASLTVVSYFSYVPDVRQAISNNPNIPFQSELLRMDTQWLNLMVLLTFIALIMVKAYFIGIVWSCYKFLIYQNAARSVAEYVDLESSIPEYLPPPTYETVTKDPKAFPVYSNVMAAAATDPMAPPPPYTPRKGEEAI